MPAATLQVGGVTPFTSIDFPGRLAAVVFVQGCPWRCGYCHNPHLQPRAANDDTATPWRQFVDWVRRRTGLLDGVVFSGGEPTIDAALPAAAAELRALGFEIGLHTAGIYPRRLRELLPLLSWVGLDVKAPLSRPGLHDGITGARGGVTAVRASLELLLASGVYFECRTTARPDQLSPDDLIRLADELARAGVRRYALQLAHGGTPGRHGFDLSDYLGAQTLEQLSRRFESFVFRSGR